MRSLPQHQCNLTQAIALYYHQYAINFRLLLRAIARIIDSVITVNQAVNH